MVTPKAKKACSQILIEEYKMSERRACCLTGQHRSMQRYRSRKINEGELSEKVRGIAYERKRYGYRRIHLILKRDGIKVNHKKIYRSLKIVVDTSLHGKRVTKALEETRLEYGKPEEIISDNGSEFRSNKIINWCSLLQEKKVRLNVQGEYLKEI